MVYDSELLVDMLSVPGGVANVVALGLTQFFVSPYVAIAIMTALLGVIASLILSLFKRLSNSGSLSATLALLPVIALIMLHYNLNYMASGTVAMLLMLVVLNIQVLISNWKGRLLYAVVLLPVLFFSCGAIVTLYALLSLIIELRKSAKTAAFFLVLPVLAIVRGAIGLRMGCAGDLTHLLLPNAYFTHRLEASSIVWLPWALMVVVTVVVMILDEIPSLTAFVTKKRNRQIVYSLFLVLAVGYSQFCRISYISAGNEYFKRMSCMVAAEQWEEVEQLYYDRPEDNVLYENMHGVAANEIEKRQKPDAMNPIVMIPADKTPYINALLSDAYYFTGNTGYAMRYAFEANQSLGSRSPRMLKRLALTNIQMKEYDVARKYLRILTRTLYYKDWADALLAKLPAPASAANVILPDYTDVTIPRSIAPLHFMINPKYGADEAEVVFTNAGKSVTVGADDGKVCIGTGDWRNITQSGNCIKVTVRMKEGGVWKELKTFSIHISDDAIDSYLAYRLIDPGYEIWNDMGLYQRSLTDFEETEIITNRMTNYGCMNCHSFGSQSPDRMLFHLRSDYAGTYVSINGKTEKLDTKTPYTMSALVYPSWHPSGDFVAFSVNDIQQIFHQTDTTRVEVFDNASDVVVYDVKEHRLITTPRLMRDDKFETFPTFSPDGKTMYFCSADSVEMPAGWSRVRYSLCSIAFDAGTKSFGEKIDTLYSAATGGKSATFPRVSPDGRYLMYVLSSCGNFTIWHNDADLYMKDLRSGAEVPTTVINSRRADSYHSWSSNGRWVVFSSRRDDGLYTRPYIAHVGKDGRFSKPFVLPQDNPQHYDMKMKSFNVPEFVKGKISHSSYELSRVARTTPISVQ